MRKWDDTFYVELYDLARQGNSNTKIAQKFGVGIKVLNKWMAKKPAIVTAFQRARDLTPDADNPNTLTAYIYTNMSQETRDLWDQINEVETGSNSIARIEAILEGEGILARQNLFIHALATSNYDINYALRKVCISRQAFSNWCMRDPVFQRAMDDMQESKKDFYENALIGAVSGGEASAIIFANKTLNRDRGYNEKIDVFYTHKDSNEFNIDQLPVHIKEQILEWMETQDAIRIDGPVIEGGVKSG